MCLHSLFINLFQRLKFVFVFVLAFWHFFQSSDYTKSGETDPAPVTSPKDPEDIPTFDEWKKKVMEVEKEKSKEALGFD